MLISSANMRLWQKWMTDSERALLGEAKERLQMNLKFPLEFSQTELDELDSMIENVTFVYNFKLADTHTPSGISFWKEQLATLRSIREKLWPTKDKTPPTKSVVEDLWSAKAEELYGAGFTPEQRAYVKRRFFLFQYSGKPTLVEDLWPEDIWDLGGFEKAYERLSNFHAEQRCKKKLDEIEAKLDDILKGLD